MKLVLYSALICSILFGGAQAFARSHHHHHGHGHPRTTPQHREKPYEQTHNDQYKNRHKDKKPKSQKPKSHKPHGHEHRRGK